MSVPNQMIIQEFNYEPCSDKDSTEYYAKVNLLALQHAMQDLGSLNALKLWLYLSKNKQGFSHLELSSADCVNNWGMGKSQWKDAKQTLVDRGYLVPMKQDKKTGWYNFIQNPDSGLRVQSEIGEVLPEIGFLFDDEIPETGKNIIVQIPETGILNTKSGLINPEIVGERLQYYIDNIIIDNIDEWKECRGYTLKYATENLNCQVVAEDDQWYYVITGNNCKIRFDKSKNSQYMDYANLF